MTVHKKFDLQIVPAVIMLLHAEENPEKLSLPSMRRKHERRLSNLSFTKEYVDDLTNRANVWIGGKTLEEVAQLEQQYSLEIIV